MKLKKRGRPKGSVKAPLSPPQDKMIQVAPTRKCPKCGRTTKSKAKL